MSETSQILIVDDEADFRNLMRLWFRGYNIIEASDGQEAIDLLKKPNLVDLILLDVVMPKMSGTEALKKIKQIVPTVKVIIMTGYSSKAIAIESLKNRADYYLEKPFSSEELITAVEKLLKEKHDAEGKIISDPEENISKIKRFVERNYDKKVCLNDAAAEVSLSGKYLSRLFKQRVGITFRNYIISLKVKKSKEMLQFTSFSIKQISSSLGYENPESFIRAFFRHVKKSPSNYRRFVNECNKVNA